MNTMFKTLIETVQPAQVVGDTSIQIKDVVYDTNDVTPGALFCCIPGQHFDGHDFAKEAIERGASALLVERLLDVEVPQAQLASVREVIGPLSSKFFGDPSAKLKLVGVTGTNGKTTTTYFLADIGRALGVSSAFTGTTGTQVGDEHWPLERTTPEAPDLQRLLSRLVEVGVTFAAMEVSSHALAQQRVHGTRFSVVGFTNLSHDHLDYHADLDDYFAAKARLFNASYSDQAAINVDDPYGLQLVQIASDAGMSVSRVSLLDNTADICARDIALSENFSSFVLDVKGKSVHVELPLLGNHNIANALMAAACAFAIGAPVETIAEGLSTTQVVPGRVERIDAGQPFTVMVDYAHSPHSLYSVLTALRGVAKKRVICVFGCGGDRDQGKRPEMGKIAGELADFTIVTSDNPRSEDPEAIIAAIIPGVIESGGAFEVEPDRRAAISSALSHASDDDIVLIAGKGHEQGQQIGNTIVPFDDRAVARELLREQLK